MRSNKYRASVMMPEDLVEDVDVLVVRSDEYENRSEWIVDAMREKLHREKYGDD